jgi:endonuclease G
MDRGHMCPAGDNRWHWKAMQESFYMTNICPQNHNLNRGDWKELEDACRLWTKKEGKLYIVCGPVLYRQKHRTIGRKHKVTVPEAFFKVILSTRNGHPKAIGFIFKNLSGNHPLKNYVNSVDEVERITGIDFFPALPDDVEKKVEAMQDLNLWSFR